MNSTNDSNKMLDEFRNFYQEHLCTFEMPDRLSGVYAYRDCLKQSSYKEIYLLSDRKGNLFVLKKGMGKQLSQIKQEAQILDHLNNAGHISVPRYIDYWEENGAGYLLRTYIQGISLADYFERRLYLTEQEIVDYMLEICYLAQILHAQNPPIIHRDMKPENFVMEKGTGILYLVDYDTARQYIPDKSRDTSLIGTPSHAAPEQFGFSQSDVRTDIYAIGKTLLYLSCGSTEENAGKTSVIDKSLRKIITRCTSFTPDNRYSSVSQLIHALKRYQNRLTGSTICIRQIVTVFTLLACGIFLGYQIGTLGHRQNASFDVHNIISGDMDTGNPGNASSSAEGIPMESGISGTTGCISASGNVSLLEQSGVLQCDILQFQNIVNQIILDYYNNDAKAMAKNCERLVEALYQDEAISQFSGTDYAGYNKIPISSELSSAVTLTRNLLAYRNQVLRRELGGYNKYKDYIYFEMSCHLELAMTNTENALYQYSTRADDAAMDYYHRALTDILGNIVKGIDKASGIEQCPF